MRLRLVVALSSLVYIGTQACADNAEDSFPRANVAETPSGDAGSETPVEFDPLPLRVGASKAKDLLTGLPLTSAELAAAADREALKTLVDTWMALPQFDDAMLRFFADAFQQSGLGADEVRRLALALGLPNNFEYFYGSPKVRRALDEMFARTALGIVQEARPFTEVATTTRFKLNTPLMATLLFVDAHPSTDNAQAVQDSWLLKRYKNFTFTGTFNIDPSSGQPVPIPIADSMDEKKRKLHALVARPCTMPRRQGQLLCNRVVRRRVCVRRAFWWSHQLHDGTCVRSLRMGHMEMGECAQGGHWRVALRVLGVAQASVG